jgi:phosphatidylglycerophosphate synthase
MNGPSREAHPLTAASPRQANVSGSIPAATSREPMKPWDSRLARWLVRPLHHTAVTPNHLTTASLLSGLTAAALYASGERAAANWGGALYMLSALLDHADGEFARDAGKASAFGHMYDRLCDLVARSALFLGMALSTRAVLGGWAVLCGVAGAAALVGIFALRSDMAEHQVPGALDQPSGAGFDLGDVLYLIGPLTWLGWLPPFVLAAGLGTPVFCLWTARKRRMALAGAR